MDFLLTSREKDHPEEEQDASCACYEHLTACGLPSSRLSDWWTPALQKRMLSDSGLGMITPHYDDADIKDLSHSRVLQ